MNADVPARIPPAAVYGINTENFLASQSHGEALMWGTPVTFRFLWFRSDPDWFMSVCLVKTGNK
jgi:hypothetical protein